MYLNFYRDFPTSVKALTDRSICAALRCVSGERSGANKSVAINTAERMPMVETIEKIYSKYGFLKGINR